MTPSDPMLNLALAALFGAAVYTMYPVIVAHANDHALPGTFIQVSGGLLLVFGLGSIVGPTAAGFAMANVGTNSLFMVTGAAHAMMIAFALLRLRSRAAVPQGDKTAFVAAPLGRSTTPETAALAESDEERDAHSAGQRPPEDDAPQAAPTPSGAATTGPSSEGTDTDPDAAVPLAGRPS
jgi:MFS family permease